LTYQSTRLRAPILPHHIQKLWPLCSTVSLCWQTQQTGMKHHSPTFLTLRQRHGFTIKLGLPGFLCSTSAQNYLYEFACHGQHAYFDQDLLTLPCDLGFKAPAQSTGEISVHRTTWFQYSARYFQQLTPRTWRSFCSFQFCTSVYTCFCQT